MAYKIRVWPPYAREGDIPYNAIWSDGSRYMVRFVDDGKTIERSYSGQMFTKTRDLPEGMVYWEREDAKTHLAQECGLA